MLDVVHMFLLGYVLTCALLWGLRVGFWIFASRDAYLYFCEVFSGLVIQLLALLDGILFVCAYYLGRV